MFPGHASTQLSSRLHTYFHLCRYTLLFHEIFHLTSPLHIWTHLHIYILPGYLVLHFSTGLYKHRHCQTSLFPGHPFFLLSIPPDISQSHLLVLMFPGHASSQLSSRLHTYFHLCRCTLHFHDIFHLPRHLHIWTHLHKHMSPGHVELLSSWKTMKLPFWYLYKLARISSPIIISIFYI